MTPLPDSRILFSAADVQQAIDTVAADLEQRCQGHDWLLLTVLHGGMMFASELLRRLSVPLQTDVVRVSRYGDATTGGELRWVYEPTTDLSGARVLVVDDIFDEGETLQTVVDYCRQHGARETLSAVLLDKQHERKTTQYRPDYASLTCADDYVFGCGMDYQGYWRNLPEIRVLAAEH